MFNTKDLTNPLIVCMSMDMFMSTRDSKYVDKNEKKKEEELKEHNKQKEEKRAKIE